MSRFRLLVLTGLAAAFLPGPLWACLWDYDTLQMERSRFPTAMELITGKFLRHSKEFYQWRIGDRRDKLYLDPDNLAYLDDLAVAYDKTGHQDKAIEAMLAKDKKKPGLYETEANLGTFLIHAGRLKEGLVHIDRALRINPDAHFGREKYQKLLVEFVLERQKGSVPALPVAEDREGKGTFAAFLIEKQGSDRRVLDEAERKAAIKGLLGIMRFGNHESPVILEALASVLCSREFDVGSEDAKQLAARAYLKAADGAKDPKAKEAYRTMAASVLTMQLKSPTGSHTTLSMEELEQAFTKEREQGKEWYADLHQAELSWIREGKDPEAEFSKRYAEEPQVRTEGGEEAAPWFSRREMAAVGVLAALLLLPVWIILRLTVLRRRKTSPVGLSTQRGGA